MIGTESAVVVADSTEDNEETQNDGASSASANCESVEEYVEDAKHPIPMVLRRL